MCIRDSQYIDKSKFDFKKNKKKKSTFLLGPQYSILPNNINHTKIKKNRIFKIIINFGGSGNLNLSKNIILQFIRKGQIEAVHSIIEEYGEVISVEAIETSSIIGKPLKEIKLPKDVSIGSIVKKKDNSIYLLEKIFFVQNFLLLRRVIKIKC